MTRSTLLVLALAGCCAPAERPAATAVRGTVRYLGERLKVRTIVVEGIPGMPPGGIPHEELILDDDGGVKNALVYVSSGLQGGTVPPPETAAVIEVKDLVFKPHVAAVQVGQSILVHNRDSTLHFVRAFPEKNPRINRGLPARDEPQWMVFREPEIMVKLRCDIHPWMSAWIGVLDHPYFAVTGAPGRFEIPGLPPGKYTLRLWHEKLGAKDQEIDLVRNATADFECARK